MKRIEITKAFDVKEDLKKWGYHWNQTEKAWYKKNIQDEAMAMELGRIKAIGKLDNAKVFEEGKDE